MLLFLFAIFSRLVSSWASRNFLVADFFEPDGDCNADLLQLSIIQEVGAGCIDRPLTWLPDGSADNMQSYEILSCESGTSQLQVIFMVYTEKTCTGNGHLITTGNELSSKNCVHDNMLFSCQHEPISLSERWPAVDLFFNNNTCGESAVTVSLRPGCITMGRSMFGWSCNDQNTSLSHETYATPMTCSDGVTSASYSVPTEECLLNNLSPLGYNVDKSSVSTELGYLFQDNSLGKYSRSYYYEWYYVARCAGY